MAYVDYVDDIAVQLAELNKNLRVLSLLIAKDCEKYLAAEELIWGNRIQKIEKPWEMSAEEAYMDDRDPYERDPENILSPEEDPIEVSLFEIAEFYKMKREKEERKELLEPYGLELDKHSISELELETRYENALIASNVYTIGDLYLGFKTDSLFVRRVSKKVLLTIKERLTEWLSQELKNG